MFWITNNNPRTLHAPQDLVDVAIALQRNKMKDAVKAEVSAAVENRILDILAGDAAQVIKAPKPTTTPTHTYTRIHTGVHTGVNTGVLVEVIE
jgi:ATP-dependent protease HslVU (ClpYQ) ATPase subunit